MYSSTLNTSYPLYVDTPGPVDPYPFLGPIYIYIPIHQHTQPYRTINIHILPHVGTCEHISPHRIIFNHTSFDR